MNQEPIRRRIIKATKLNLQCKDCGYIGYTHTLGSFASYGRLLGRTSYNELAEFNAWNDKVFDEVSNLVDKFMSEGNPWKTRCLDRVLGLACDPAPSGKLFNFVGKIGCPKCGSVNVKYGADNPPIVEEIHLPFVTHKIWQSLTLEDKQGRIMNALKVEGCLSE